MATRAAARKSAKISDPDLVEFLSPRDIPRPCKLSRLISELDEENQRKVRKALDHPKITPYAIADFLSARSKTVSDGAVRSHRAGRCLCFR